jgi:hypothetical protein
MEWNKFDLLKKKKKKKKKKKRTNKETEKTMKERQDEITNYLVDKAGLMGYAARSIKKRKKELENVMKQTE